MSALAYPEIAAACAAVALAYAVFGFSGFGANLVALPLLAQLVGLRMAVPLLLMLDLVATSLLSSRNRSSIDAPVLRRLVPPLLLGMALGLPVLHLSAERWLLVVLGLFVGGLALWNLLGQAAHRSISPRWAWPAGLAGGVFSTLFGTGGPIYMLYLTGSIADLGRLRATMGAVILGSALVRLVLFTGSGLLAQRGLLPLAAALAPCAFVGYWGGSRLHHRLPQAQVRRGIWLLLLASGASLLLNGWRNA